MSTAQRKPVVLITGSAGLVGSSCVRAFAAEGYSTLGLDNDSRRSFFGPQASTSTVVEVLEESIPDYRHLSIDIRDRRAIRSVFEYYRPSVIIHTAAQPSHDKAAAIPYEDFDVNAVGTLNLLVAARDFCPSSPFCFTSTNKVYGDRPNQLPLVELDSRYDYLTLDAIDESMPIDQCLHSLFGASKVAADVLCQEFGRYFSMPVGIFRGGCLTGPSHAAVELHGFLNYIVRCAVHGKPFVIFGHKGKQVRDQIHADDVAALFLEFSKSPHCGEVYNIGGGRNNSASILEIIEILADMGLELSYRYSEQSRMGDHICYVTDLNKVRDHFPNWKINYNLRGIIEVIAEESLQKLTHPPPAVSAQINAQRLPS